MSDITERLSKCVKDENGQPLVCYGCAHSATYMLYSDGSLVEGTDFPGMPSGERPCCFCLRNPEWETWHKDTGVDVWYDGSKPVSLPQDNYHSLGMFKQMVAWDKEDAGK